MSLNEVANQKVFKGLTDPYTGKPVTVRVVAGGRDMPLFFSPDAYDPSNPVPTVKELLAAAGTRNGVSGAASDGKELICPYTGAHMSISSGPEGACLKGGFRPSRPVTGAANFNYLMRMRGGESEIPKPDAEPVVAFTAPYVDVPPASSGEPKDFSKEYAEKILAPMIPKRTVVTVPRRPANRRKG